MNFGFVRHASDVCSESESVLNLGRGGLSCSIALAVARSWKTQEQVCGTLALLFVKAFSARSDNG